MAHKIKIFGVGLFILGILIMNLGGVGLFGLSGNCPDGLISCQHYPEWQWVGRSGVILIVIGSITILIGIIKQDREK